MVRPTVFRRVEQIDSLAWSYNKRHADCLRILCRYIYVNNAESAIAVKQIIDQANGAALL